ncbi:helix-turn-helix domain-containing protein [Candidatus Wolfebacteria bacterium]|nr:helix-turn-helix domain-containing protein [Candidatus Wolfebacteria bacterium]
MSKFFTTEENKKIEESAWQNFLIKFKKDVSSKNIGEVLETLLSTYEKRELSRRLAIILLLGQGKTYREVSQVLGVSHQTIGAAKKCFLEKSIKSYNPYHKKLKQIKPLRGLSFMDDLSRILSKAPKYRYIGKGGRWRFLNALS